MQGIITTNQIVVVIRRLAINSKYNVYCLERIPITQTIKWLIENTKIRNLELSRGDEKYKYAYGGKEHYNYTFIYKNGL